MNSEWKSIEKLTEHEAKIFLSQMLAYIKRLEANNDLQQDMLNGIGNAFEQFVERKVPPEIEHKAVHITSGESAAGSIRVGMGHEHKVIGFPDFFSMGPLYHLHEAEGRKLRREWLMDHISTSDDFYEDEYDDRFEKAVGKIKNIPNQLPIILWIGENANEQIGLRYVISLLENKPNCIYVINSTGSYEELISTDEVRYELRHTGEMIPDKVKLIYEQELGSSLTDEQRSTLASEWKALSETKEVLRILDKLGIKSVAEDYFDSFIVEKATELHERYGKDEFIKASRLVGEVYGNLDDLIGDGYIEYRIRSLVYKGVFEIKGVPKGMRYYRVRLK